MLAQTAGEGLLQLTEFGFPGMSLMSGERIEFAINTTDSSGRMESKNAEALLLTDSRIIHLKGPRKNHRAIMTAVQDVDSVEITSLSRGVGVYVWAALAFVLALILFVTIDNTVVRLVSSAIVLLMGVYLVVSEITEPKKPAAVFRAGPTEIRWEFRSDQHTDDVNQFINRLYQIKEASNGRFARHDYFAPR
jgi:hypothetical protein